MSLYVPIQNWCDCLDNSISQRPPFFDPSQPHGPHRLAPVARHMTEFTGLDIEMTFKDHYHEASGAKRWHNRSDQSHGWWFTFLFGGGLWYFFRGSQELHNFTKADDAKDKVLYHVFMSCWLNSMRVPEVTGQYRVGLRALGSIQPCQQTSHLNLCGQNQVLAVLDGLFNHIFKGPDELGCRVLTGPGVLFRNFKWPSQAAIHVKDEERCSIRDAGW